MHVITYLGVLNLHLYNTERLQSLHYFSEYVCWHRPDSDNPKSEVTPILNVINQNLFFFLHHQLVQQGQNATDFTLLQRLQHLDSL